MAGKDLPPGAAFAGGRNDVNPGYRKKFGVYRTWLHALVHVLWQWVADVESACVGSLGSPRKCEVLEGLLLIPYSV